jgi:transcriptional accessory protein Tex/SPT6
MSIQSNNGNGAIDHSSVPTSTKGILTKIFKNQHNRQQAMQNHQHQNYIDHMNQTQIQFQGGRGGAGAPNIIKQLKSPNNNLREHLHTQGRTRA